MSNSYGLMQNNPLSVSTTQDDVQNPSQASRRGASRTGVSAPKQTGDTVEVTNARRGAAPTDRDSRYTPDMLELLLESQTAQTQEKSRQIVQGTKLDFVDAQYRAAELVRERVATTDGHVRLQKAEQRDKKQTDAYREEGKQVPQNGAAQASGSGAH